MKSECNPDTSGAVISVLQREKELGEEINKKLEGYMLTI
jgi:hypothetical protein